VTREQGELVDWRDERGFGFIQRPGGAGKIYVHMKSIGKSVDRPKPGDHMDYAIGSGKDGRPIAIDVKIIGAPPKPAPASAPLREARTVLGISTRVVAAAVILALLSANIILYRLPVWVAALYLIAGAGSFILYRGDKRAAETRAWRKPERRLQLLDLTFGIVGGLFAQHVFRHKTYKPGFVTVTALITALHVLLLGLILFGVYAPGSLGEFFRNLKMPG
jgi:uncharacterized membrane protein YsdA (DUF1294 family)/cold shock CspA family protein